MKVELNDYMIPSDYARLIGKSVTWVNFLITEGRLECIKHYGRSLVNVSSVREKDKDSFNEKVKDIERRRLRI